MKKFKIFLCLIFTMGVAMTSFAQKNEMVDLSGTWKFIQGDQLKYADPAFNDSSWKNIKVDNIWESQGYDPYDGFAWYRVKFTIPSSLRKNAYLKDSLVFFLGKVNNFDQTFLNGQILGINAKTTSLYNPADSSFLKAPMQMYDRERRYVLPIDDPRIRWDAENTIAIRVFDQGGQGGMYTGNQHVSMTSLMEYLHFTYGAQAFVLKNKVFNKSVKLSNVSTTHTLRGTFTITMEDKQDGSLVNQANAPINLKPGELWKTQINCPNRDHALLVKYEVSLNETGEKMTFREESPYILTPVPGKKPQINGALVYGARSKKPFLYTIAATGKRPMIFKAEPLPTGLSIDPSTGIISGCTQENGEYLIRLSAKNSLGSDQKTLKLVIGDAIALTPPMGWNSWNCWGLTVDMQKVIASARVFKEMGLMDHGWSFINIDDGWEIYKDAEPKRNPDGTIITNKKFPDMKKLGDSIHALGLKFGIYSSPGRFTCGEYTASYMHELQDAQSYASWGVDYLKYDWCSYEKIAKDNSRIELMKPYRVMRDALNKVNRDIVYSLCQYGMGNVWEWGSEVGGNLWRTTGDIEDTWASMSEIGFNQLANQPYAGPGHWNDPDMLVTGWVGWGPSLHPTRLTPDEQYTHISLWCMLSAPLLIGCDLTRLDPFTLNLLTNDEVLGIDQDPLGTQAKQKIKEGNIQVWIKDLADKQKAAGIFNLGEKPVTYILSFEKAGLSPTLKLRDLWRQKDLGSYSGSYTVVIPAHGVVVLKAFNR
ncbi:MAG: putative Ig domain-containing protein [Bacteroidales bacterium]|nr:putative Ig domain-containing protein [Bacteroidales bacterium]